MVGKKHSGEADRLTLANGGSECALLISWAINEFQFVCRYDWFLLRLSHSIQNVLITLCKIRQFNTI